jgi:hypothetical protein
MDFAKYLMSPVTPLYDYIPSGGATIDQSFRSAISDKRAAEMAARYRNKMAGKGEMSSTEIGAAVGVSRVLTGLRKLEARGLVRMVRMSSDKRGRKQAIWEWK